MAKSLQTPDWVRVVGRRANRLDLVAAPLSPSGQPVSDWHLTVSFEHELEAREKVPGTRLPPFCPELHVEEGGKFCLGNRHYAPARVGVFWEDLAAFLRNQDYAARRHRWPTGQWLSHGHAADHQLQAEQLATQAGWAREYAAWLENGEGWLAGPLPRLSRDQSRLVNARSLCPRGCRTRRGRPIVRAACRQRHLLEGLIKAEYARQSAEREFFAELYRRKKTCCRRMPDCPLRVLEDEKNAPPPLRTEVEPLWKRRQRKGKSRA